jgi:hypothetical protein
MSEGTVTSAYNAARRSRDSQGQGSRSSDPDDLMRGRTFIPRMSEASRQLMIEALQKAKKKRQERLAKKKGDSPEPPEDNKPFNVSPEIVNKTVSDFSAFIDEKGFRGRKEEDATTDNQYDESYDGQAMEGYKYDTPDNKSTITDDIYNYNANGGKIPKFKRRTLKFRK